MLSVRVFTKLPQSLRGSTLAHRLAPDPSHGNGASGCHRGALAARLPLSLTRREELVQVRELSGEGGLVVGEARQHVARGQEGHTASLGDFPSNPLGLAASDL